MLTVRSDIRALEPGLDALDAADRLDVVGLGVLADPLIADNAKTVHQVVEDEGIARDHEDAVGSVRADLARDVGQFFPEPGSVVAQVADRPAREGREVSLAIPGPRSHEVTDSPHGIPGAEGARALLVAPRHFLAVDTQARNDLHPKEGIAAEGSAAGRFEEVGGAEGIEGVDGREAVGGDVLQDGQHVTSLGRGMKSKREGRITVSPFKCYYK